MSKESEDRQAKIKSLTTWVGPKLIQIRELECNIEVQKVMNRQIKENVENNFYIHQKEKEIKEQQNTPNKQLKELELERLKRDLESGYYEKKAALELENLEVLYRLEQDALEDIKKKIKLMERNHKDADSNSNN